MREVWRDVAVSRGRYQVSSLGKVRNFNTGREMKVFLDKDGYPSVCLPFAYENPRWRRFQVHRLIASAFLNLPPYSKENGYMQVNHKDGVKVNSVLCNLEVVTSKENDAHATAMRLKAKSVMSLRGRAALTSADASLIRKLHGSGVSTGFLARVYERHPQTIRLLVRGETWSDR